MWPPWAGGVDRGFPSPQGGHIGPPLQNPRLSAPLFSPQQKPRREDLPPRLLSNFQAVGQAGDGSQAGSQTGDSGSIDFEEALEEARQSFGRDAHPAVLHLHRDVVVTLKVKVVAEGGQKS